MRDIGPNRNVGLRGGEYQVKGVIGEFKGRTDWVEWRAGGLEGMQVML